MSRPAEQQASTLETHSRPELRVIVSEPKTEARQFLTRGTPAYKRASFALFLSGFATFSLLYCVQPLMPIFAQDFGVSPAASSLSLSLSTGFLAFAIFCAAAVSEGLGRRSLMFVSLMWVSGVPFVEAQALRSRGDDYRAYQRRTSVLIPWFPKKDGA